MPRAMDSPSPPPPRRVRGPRALAAERHVEHARQVTERYPAALVGHGHARAPRPDLADQLDRAIRRRVPDRVRDQVLDRTAELRRVDKHRHAGGDRPGQQDALGAGDRFRARGHLGEQVTEADEARRQAQRARVDLRQLEEVLDHRGEPVRLHPHLGVVVVDLARIGDHLVLERLGHRPQPGERRAQVVADPGDQFPAARLERLLACPCAAEPVVRLGEPERQARQFGRQRDLRRRVDAAAADLAHRDEQPPRRAGDRPADEERDKQAGQSRDAHQLEHHLPVGEAEHAVGDHADRGERGDHRD